MNVVGYRHKPMRDSSEQYKEQSQYRLDVLWIDSTVNGTDTEDRNAQDEYS